MMKTSTPLMSIGAVADGWSSVSPEKQFFGMTLEQFKTAVKPCYDVRTEIVDVQKRLKSLIAKRKDADAAAIKLTKNIVHAVKADPTEGENSPLYAAMGYVRANDRSSGLTRVRGAISSAPGTMVPKEELATT